MTRSFNSATSPSRLFIVQRGKLISTIFSRLHAQGHLRHQVQSRRFNLALSIRRSQRRTRHR
jgi:hypothetical protein